MKHAGTMTTPISLTALVALTALSLLAGTASSAGTSATPPAPRAASGSAPNAAAAVQPDAEAPFNVLGREDAPVAMVEFSDLQCPYCATYALRTFPQLKRAYIDTGKLHYAAVSFPLPSHAFAFPAAVAARCAGEQGQFWKFRDAIFADQAQLASDPYDALAGKLGLDVAKFKACRRDIRQDSYVREDLAMARRDGIASTPSFMLGRVVDGEFQGGTFSGSKSFEEISAMIDKLIADGK
jgi:protein-disulfide isomerase